MNEVVNGDKCNRRIGSEGNGRGTVTMPSVLGRYMASDANGLYQKGGRLDLFLFSFLLPSYFM